MRSPGISSHPISLGVIAIGAMIDAAILMIENAQQHFDSTGRKDYRRARVNRPL